MKLSVLLAVALVFAQLLCAGVCAAGTSTGDPHGCPFHESHTHKAPACCMRQVVVAAARSERVTLTGALVFPAIAFAPAVDANPPAEVVASGRFTTFAAAIVLRT